MKKIRLDVLMAERGLAESRAQAQRMVMAGQVLVNGQMALKPSVQVLPQAEISVQSKPLYVSRGGEKIAPALKAFNLEKLDGWVCVDVGASTGGFTDCLLQHGAQRVYAVDVGYGVLHWKLRNDARVIVMERTNARYVESFPEVINLVTVDASFISLRVLLPVIRQWFGGTGGQAIVLIKPQFEAGKADAARGEGVIRDPQVHRQVLLDVLGFLLQGGYGILGLQRSSLTGPKGNIEFLAHLVYPAGGEETNLEEWVERVLEYPV